MVSANYVPIEATELVSLIKRLLTVELGTIEGTNKAAVIIEPPVFESPVRGIRVLIDRTAAFVSSMPLSNYQRSIDAEWIVTVTQFDLSEKGMKRFDNAIGKMRGRFPHSRDVAIPPSIGNYPQVKFRLLHTQILGASIDD